MKFLDILHLSLSEIKAHKFKSIIYLLIISLFTLLIFGFCSGIKSFNKTFDAMFNADFHFRFISVNPLKESKEDVIRKIENLHIPSITHIYYSNDKYATSVIVNDENKAMNGYITLFGIYDGIEYEVDSGRKVLNDNEMVCSSLFSTQGILAENASELSDIKGYVGNNLPVTYNQYLIHDNKESSIYKQYNTSLKLVGTFDSKKNFIEYGNCFVSSKTLEKILNDTKKVFESPKMEQEYIEAESYLNAIVVVDSYRNVDSVVKTLNDNGINATVSQTVDLSFLQTISSLLIVGFIFLLVISIICIYIFINGTFKENKKNVALYRFLGYGSKTIRKIFLIQYEFLTILSLLISIILTFLFREVAILVISTDPAFTVLKVTLSFWEGILYFCLILGIVFITTHILFGKKFKNMQVLSLMEAKE